MPMLRTHIVIRNGDEMRLVRRRPLNLASNEVAIEVIINAPVTPQVVASVTVDLPTPPPATATVGVITYADEDDYREEGE